MFEQVMMLLEKMACAEECIFDFEYNELEHKTIKTIIKWVKSFEERGNAECIAVELALRYILYGKATGFNSGKLFTVFARAIIRNQEYWRIETFHFE